MIKDDPILGEKQAAFWIKIKRTEGSLGQQCPPPRLGPQKMQPNRGHSNLACRVSGGTPVSSHAAMAAKELRSACVIPAGPTGNPQ